MSTHGRSGRRASIIREAAARFLGERANRSPLITVTEVELSGDGRQATILVSIFPEIHSALALAYLRRSRGALREFIKKETRLKDAPIVDFAMDKDSV